MERDQREKYVEAIAGAIALVIGPRDADYNRGGVGLRDYWAINGIKSPLQLVDMKLKRALSQLSTWQSEPNGKLYPPSRESIDKLTESMLDLINYAAFVVCEANSLPVLEAVDIMDDRLMPGIAPSTLAQRINEAIELWRKM